MRAVILQSGHQMSVKMVCLGWHWQPYRYTRTDDEGAQVQSFLSEWSTWAEGR